VLRRRFRFIRNARFLDLLGTKNVTSQHNQIVLTKIGRAKQYANHCSSSDFVSSSFSFDTQQIEPITLHCAPICYSTTEPNDKLIGSYYAHVAKRIIIQTPNALSPFRESPTWTNQIALPTPPRPHLGPLPWSPPYPLCSPALPCDDLRSILIFLLLRAQTPLFVGTHYTLL
jgi:hypothetical protein